MKNTSKNNIKKAQSFVTILGIKINSTRKEELLNAIREKLSQKIHFYIVTPNPEIVLQAQNEPKLTHSLNSADFSVPDGVGLKFAAPELQIIKGRELFLDLLKIANERKLKVYLLGGRDFVNKRAQDFVKSQYPNIIVSGSSPYVEVNSTKQFEVVKEINFFEPDLLFVAFGAPKQELWVDKFKSQMPNVKGIMVVGGTLDYFAGVVKPVPGLFANLHLEWFWRVIQEPKRIGRIFNAVIIFPMKVILSKIST